jgi:hypothetical protein
VRESERKRYADPTFVDKVIELDAKWREGALAHSPLKPEISGQHFCVALSRPVPEQCGCNARRRPDGSACAALATRAVRFKLDHINREYNATNKEVAKKKMVRPRPGLGAADAHGLTAFCARVCRPRRTLPLRLLLAKRSTSAALRQRRVTRSAVPWA